MKMKILLTSISVLLFLTGCSTTGLSDSQVESLSKPTLTLNCTQGCSASYTDPRDRPSLPTNGYDVMNTAIGATANVITSTAPWAAIGITAAKGISNAGGNDNSVDNRSWTETNDSTHKPTVVEQPDPIIVDQPSPVIVEQPAPVLVGESGRE